MKAGVPISVSARLDLRRCARAWVEISGSSNALGTRAEPNLRWIKATRYERHGQICGRWGVAARGGSRGLSLYRLRSVSETVPADTSYDSGPNPGLLIVSLVGITLSFGMVVGSLAPWVHLSKITISGWAGIGIPVVFAGFIALGFHALHLFVPKRWILIVTGLIGAVGVCAAAFVSLLVWSLSGAKGLLIALLARGAHREEFNHASTISLGWGIAVLAVCSFGLILLSFAVLAGGMSGSSMSLHAPRRKPGKATREKTAWETPELTSADVGLAEPDGVSGLDKYR